MPARRPVPTFRDVRARLLAGMLARDAYERQLQDEVLDVLEASFHRVAADVLTTAPTLQASDRQRLAALYRRIRQELVDAYASVDRLTGAAVPQLAGVELDAAAAELRALVVELGGTPIAVDRLAPVISPQSIRAIAELPIDGLPLGEWWKSQAANMSLTTRRAIQTGLVLGEHPSVIAARIVPPRGAVTPAAWRQARAQASTIVRTTTTAVHSEAALATYAGVGNRVTESYELLTARDSRVSKICAALDGEVYRYDDPDRKVPPFHLNCRTTTLPIINHQALGLKPPGPRSPLTLQSFATWLGKQPAATQRDVLGATRANWFREGKLTLRQLIDEDNRVLTLEELADVLGTAADVPAIARSRPAS